jgi:DEAD/DEAH box helicase domain-containing protein
MSTIPDLIKYWKKQSIADPLSSYYTLEAAYQGAFSPFPEDMHPYLIENLKLQGISAFYQHQLQAWQLINKKRDFVISTPTASGKTFAYLLPILQRILENPHATVLMIFPTKALAQDQYNLIQQALTQLNKALTPAKPLAAGIYDGDTPQHMRRHIRQHVNILLTNPDMLHLGILPNHTAWHEFFENLSIVVVDEIHIYRGIFGSHVANIFRRLLRICNFYQSKPLMIGTSATIANPETFAASLFGRPVEIINQSTAPRGDKHFLLFNPPIINPDLNLRESASAFSMRVLPDLVAYHKQTLVFVKSRRAVELLTRKLRDLGTIDAEDISSYRSGYKPQERRQIEQNLKNGKARIVFATNALELGIDIGGLDAVLLVGYPGTIASTLQQFGRSGRKGTESVAIFVASNSAVDQFIVRHPEFLLERSSEHAIINPDNLLLLMDHIRCAAFELPFIDRELYGNTDVSLLTEFLNVLTEMKDVQHVQDKYYWIGTQYPAEKISIRSLSNGPIELYANDRESSHWIGEVDEDSAFSMVHPNAIYFHMGETYQVNSLDMDSRKAFLSPIVCDYYTMPKGNVEITILQNLQNAQVRQAQKWLAEIEVFSQIIGYKCIDLETQIVRAEYTLDLPSHTMQTRGFFLQFDQQMVSRLTEEGIWNSYTNDYGHQWKAIRNAILERDHDTCQNCGTLGPGNHVHHLRPLKNFRSLAEANQPGNLITLCEHCHRIAEQKVKVQSILYGTGHLLHGLAPLIAMCDAKDLDFHHEYQDTPYAPYVMIYEKLPGGIGLTDTLFEQYDQLLHMAIQTIHECSCLDGCPGCVGPVNEYGSGSKDAVKRLLENLQ